MSIPSRSRTARNRFLVLTLALALWQGNAFARDDDAGPVPEHAFLAASGRGWICNPGYRQQGVGCVRQER